MKLSSSVESYRLREGPYGSLPNAMSGAFEIPFKGPSVTRKLRVIVSDGDITGWEHVSVSLPNRCPTWNEMDFIKDLFFDSNETVIQFHVPKNNHINIHPYCLHLWRNIKQDFELPPWILV